MYEAHLAVSLGVCHYGAQDYFASRNQNVMVTEVIEPELGLEEGLGKATWVLKGEYEHHIASLLR